MGLSAAFSRAASRAPVPVFPVAGVGARAAVDDLLVESRLQILDTPAGANVLLLAGAIPSSLAAELALLHDGLSRPRTSVWWTLGASAPPAIRSLIDVRDRDPSALVDAVVDAHRRLLIGELASSFPQLPDEDAAPWRGLGPYGQGGTGMTGGVPYGRPMAGLAPDRDGLRLDQLTVRIGPFFARFPTGLVLELRLQGDVVQGARLVLPSGDVPTAGVATTPFGQALHVPVRVSVLELERARSHLRSIASALVAHQLGSLARRVLRLAAQIRPGDDHEVEQLRRVLCRSQILGWATTGVGHISSERLEGTASGPILRASGVAHDERTDHPVYRALGFEPIVHEGSDARARMAQRLAEARQALEIAARARDLDHDPQWPLESPRGRLAAGDLPTHRILPLVPSLLEGMEWGDAVSTVVSLDLDTDEVLAMHATDPEVPVR